MGNQLFSVSEPSVPACVICLLQASDSMRSSYQTPKGPFSKLEAACLFLDHLLDWLVTRHKSRTLVPLDLDIAVISHTALMGGSCTLANLITDSSGSTFIPLQEIAQRAVERTGRRPHRWITVNAAGKAAPHHALRHAYLLAQWWLQNHLDGAPPVIIHCTDVQGFDSSYAMLSRSAQLLASTRGGLTLFHCIFSEHSNVRILPGQGNNLSRDQICQLFGSSSALDSFHFDPDIERECYSVNSLPRSSIIKLILKPLIDRSDRTNNQGFRSVPPLQTKILWTAKKGNAQCEWEDACAGNLDLGTFAIADGASEGIFSRLWADLLTRRFVEQHPDFTDPCQIANWIQRCRSEWMRDINYHSLRYTQQMKVDTIGTGSTLLTLHIMCPSDSSNKDQLSGSWEASAIGDCCLFWIRGNRLLGTFPCIDSKQFGNTPALVRTKPDVPMPGPSFARGKWQKGDLFLLATDSVSQYLLANCTDSLTPNWQRYWSMESDEWRLEIDQLREQGKIVNDDSTMLLVLLSSKNDESQKKCDQILEASVKSEMLVENFE